jgi:hypothetical protein
MKKFLTPRSLRIVAGLIVVSAFAVAPVAAQAVGTNTDLDGTLTAGVLSSTTPTITAFGTTLTGIVQTQYTEVSDWGVTDASATNLGWTVTVAASAPTVGGSAPAAGTGGSITLTPKAAVAVDDNLATAPTAGAAAALDTTPYTIESAAAGKGQGPWDFPADMGTTGSSPTNNSLAVVIPGDAGPGAYESTLTYTTAANAG